MGIHRNYVNKKTHISFYSYNFLNIDIHRKYVSFYSHSSFFYSYKLSNVGIQGNENSFFACYFKVVLDRFFWNLEFVPDDSISHYLFWQQYWHWTQSIVHIHTTDLSRLWYIKMLLVLINRKAKIYAVD